MGRELQKKKNRSSIPKVKQKPRSKHVKPLGNPIIGANWNSSQTLSQNYRRLGLASRLNCTTGGTEVSASKTSTTSKLSITRAIPTALTPIEARVERDPETGKILRVISSSTKKANPLNDPLNSDDEEDEEMGGGAGGEGQEIVRELEAQASMLPAKRVRKQSRREREWIERLVAQYGEDTAGMARDRKLNPMQQTEADIARRVRKWRKGDEGGG